MTRDHLALAVLQRLISEHGSYVPGMASEAMGRASDVFGRLGDAAVQTNDGDLMVTVPNRDGQ